MDEDVTPLFPALAKPGVPPPPLPQSPPHHFEPVREYDETWFDPVLDAGLVDLSPWTSALRFDPTSEWSSALLLRAIAPMRFTEGPTVSFLDEMSLTLSAVRLGEADLNPAPPNTPFLSRLRMLYSRMLPATIRFPVDSRWIQLAGAAAVLDRFAESPGGRISGFSQCAEVAAGDGIVVFGASPEDRARTLTAVAMPLATTVRTSEFGGITWEIPATWDGSEQLQLTSPNLGATVRLESLAEGSHLDEWINELFARAPFLRDKKNLEDRPVTVRGVDTARMMRFHWQPSGQGRLLTTIVAGVVGDFGGFSFVMDVPFEREGEQFEAPEDVLQLVEVAV